jgi:hypothetical protein
VKLEAKQRAAALLESGPEQSDSTIASEVGVCSSTVRRLRKARGLDPGYRITMDGKPYGGSPG